jgi:VWFA-related protein
MTRVFRLALLASFSALAVPVQTQQAPKPPSQTPTFRSGVELVEVEVVVTDRDGKPVHGLKASDFTVLDRGKPQEVAAIDEVRHDPPDAPLPFPPDLKMDVSDNRYGPSERLVVMVIDDYNIWKYRTDAVKDLARQVIHQLSPRASMALLYTSRTGSTEVTQDRAELLAAVDRMKGRKMVPRPGAWGGGPIGMVMRVSPERTINDAARFIRANDRRRKAFVLISETPPLGGASLELLQEDPDEGVFRTRLRYLIQTLHESNVSVYALDPRGHLTQQEMSRECFPAPRPSERDITFDPCAGENWGQFYEDGYVRRSQEGLEAFAETTGGFGIVNSDDFSGGIDRIVDALDNYYLLGFYPSDPKGNSFRRLKVSVNRPDLVVQYRRGYFAPKKEKPPKRPDPAGTLLAAPTPITALPVRVFAAAFPTGKKHARVIVSTEVEVPADRLTQADGRLGDTFAHVLVAGDMNVGKSRKQVRRTVEFSGRPAAAGAPVVFRIQSELELPPGRYQIRSAVHSQTLQQGGASYLPIDIPDLRKPSSPLGNIVLMREGSSVPGEPAGAGLPLPPTLDREFDRTAALRIYSEVTRHEDVQGTPTLVVENMNGAAVHSETLTVTAIDDRRSRVEGRLSLGSLTAGPYRLRVRLGDSGPARDVGFVMR